MKKLAIVLSTTLLALGATVATASDASARDSSWGCGGACRSAAH
jgi:hypothetical protein